MRFGVCLPNYGETGSPEAIREVALTAERLGFESAWNTDHILMPKNSGTPYEQILDCLTSLAYLAPQTSKIKLGISALIIAMRNPVVTAKQLATIDVLSGGRLMLAIGVGWNQVEYASIGSNFHNRGRRVDESIRVIKDLWGGKKEFESKLLNQKFSDAVFEPAPVQKHLPLWIAGISPAAMKRAASLGDAWHPNVQTLEAFSNLVERFRSIPNARDKEICARIAIDQTSSQSEYISGQGERRIILSSNKKENERIIHELERLAVSCLVVTTSYNGKIPLKNQISGLESLADQFIK